MHAELELKWVRGIDSAATAWGRLVYPSCLTNPCQRRITTNPQFEQ